MARTILILAANPINTSRLRLDKEVREIENGLERAQRRSDFTVKLELAARPVDVRRAMLDYDPKIVHYCGHGTGDEGLAFEDDNGEAKLISSEALAGFFELFKDRIECVVLNACYSEPQAEAIAENISYVVGMKGEIGDDTATEFAVAFYDALGAGESIEFAYKIACNAILWASIPEHLTPTLKIKAQVQQVNLIGPDPVPEPASAANEPESRILFDWVTIPAGYFMMGSDKNRDSLAVYNEKEQRLYLPEYQIARVPVTVAQFRQYRTAMQQRPTTAESQGKAHDYDPTNTGDFWPFKDGAYWEHPHGPDSEVEENHPVTCISWDDAIAFCKWAHVRLPTEAEWEKAARGTDGRIYPWGDEPPDKNRCNFGLNVGDTTPVPQELGDPPKYPAGANGLFDMAGNVWEWTSTIYRASRYDASDGREDLEAKGRQIQRVLRGGSFYQDARNVRCAYRHYHIPNATVSDIGFRVCALK